MKLYKQPGEEYELSCLRSYSPKALYFPLVSDTMFFYKMYKKPDKHGIDFNILEAAERYLVSTSHILKRVGKTFFSHASWSDVENGLMSSNNRHIVLYFQIVNTSIKNGRGYYKIRSKCLVPPLGKKYIIYASDGVETYSFSVV